MIEPILAPTPKELDDAERLFAHYAKLYEHMVRNVDEELRAFARGTLREDSLSAHTDCLKIAATLEPVHFELRQRVAAASLAKRLADIRHEILGRLVRPMLEEASRAKR